MIEKVVEKILEFIPAQYPLETIEPLHLFDNAITKHSFWDSLKFIGMEHMNRDWILSITRKLSLSDVSSNKDMEILDRRIQAVRKFNDLIMDYIRFKKLSHDKMDMHFRLYLDSEKRDLLERAESAKDFLVRFESSHRTGGDLLEEYIRQISKEAIGWIAHLKSESIDDATLGILCLITIDLELFKKKHLRDVTLFEFESKFLNKYNSSEMYALRDAIQAFEDNESAEFSRKLTLKKKPAVFKPIKFVFCIDARSSDWRRQLEESTQVLTHGFAGFLGLSFSVIDEINGCLKQGPTILDSLFEVKLNNKRGGVVHAFNVAKHLLFKLKRITALSLKIVEILGPIYFFKLYQMNLFASKSNGMMEAHYCDMNDVIENILGTHDIREVSNSLTPLLSILNLSKEKPQKIILVGHSSIHINNAYKRVVQCGACSGNSSLVNNQLATRLLNNVKVRDCLRNQGMDINPETMFEWALHDTTSDQLILKDDTRLDKEVINRVKNINAIKSRQKSQFGGYSSVIRQNHFGCIQPDIGLIRTQYLIFSSRIDLERSPLADRCFLHDYDQIHDPDGIKLAQLLDGPGMVALAIHSQYYYALAAPSLFCSGSKTLHSVIDHVGVLMGGSGKLGLGLPEESIKFKGNLITHPRRLTIICDVKRSILHKAIGKTINFKKVYENNWVTIEEMKRDVQICRNTSDKQARESDGYQRAG